MAEINVTMPSDLNTTSANNNVSYAHCSALRELRDVLDALDVGDSRTIELENQTLSLNSLTFSDGSLLNKTYVVRTNTAGRNITGRPNDSRKEPFVLTVEVIEWNNNIDYITKQTYYEADDYNTYIRYCTAGTWGEWATIDDAKYGAAGSSLGLVKSGGDVNISDGLITVKDSAITNAKIVSVNGDKIVGGTIDANQTQLINLDASNITSGTINSNLIANGAIDSSKLSSNISDSISNANTNASNAINKASQAENIANAAQMTADGKNTVYYQATVPTNAKTNDIWFNTAKDNQMSVYNGTLWVEETFGAGAISDQAISANKIAVDVNTKINDAFANAEMALGDSLEALNSANNANLAIAGWCYDNDTTYINGGKIYTGTITAEQIAANTITANEIASHTITAAQIMAGTITAESGVLAEACIKEAYIQDAAITAAKIAEATIGTAHISDLSVTNAKLADLAVTNAKIADATIENAKIKNIDAAKITTGYLSADRIEAGSLSINQFDTETRTMVSDAVETSSEALGTATANGERLNWVAEQTETNKTSIETIDGQITALISRVETTEADIEAVEGDVTTLTGNYTSLTESYNETKDTVDSHTQTIGEHSTSITNLTNADTQLNTSITEVSNKQTSLQQDLSGFKTTVSETYATQVQLSDVDGKFIDYSTTEEMNSAITQKANQITSAVSETYSTKAQLENVDGKFNNYSTTEQMNSVIDQKAGEITSSVSKTYATKSELETTNGNITGLEERVTTAEQKITDDAIVSTVTSSTSWNTLSDAAQNAQGAADEAARIANAGAKKINTHMRSFTTALWQTYGAADHEENWTTGTSYDNTHIKVGDIAYIAGTVTDAQGANTVSAMIYGEVLSVSTSSVRMKSLYYIMGGEAGAYALANTAKTNADNAQADVNSLSTRVEQTESSIKSQASSISGHESRISTVEQTADGLTVSLQTTNSNVTTAQNTANIARDEASDAAKTATNFLSYDSTDGLLVGNKSSGSWVGNRAQITSNEFNILNSSGTELASFGTTATIGLASSQNVYIDSDSVDIRNGATVLATFAPNLIELGKNSYESEISLCGGIGTIKGASSAANSVFDRLEIASSKIYIDTSDNCQIISYSDDNAFSNSLVLSNSGYNADYSSAFGSTGITSSANNGSKYTRATIYCDTYQSVNTSSIDMHVMGWNNEQSWLGLYIENGTSTASLGANTVTVNGVAQFKNGIEIFDTTPYIDFHYGNSAADYTSRIIENSSGVLTVTGGLKVNDVLDLQSAVTLRNGYQIKMAESSGTLRNVMYVGTSNNFILGYGVSGNTNIYAGGYLYLRNGSDYVCWRTPTDTATYSGHLIPGTTNKCTLGTASNRWHSVYASNTSIQTSDVREKENIYALNDTHSELFDRLRPVQFNYINNPSRISYGLIAQEVAETMEELGIGENELDLIHHDFWIDEDTNEAKESYGLAYNNLIAMLIHEVQKLKQEVAALKAA